MTPERAGGSAFALDVDPDAENVRTARLFAASIARHFGVDVERVEDIKVAVSEAVTNSIKAHQESGVDEPVRVVATVRDDGLEISVVDAGSGFHVEEESQDASVTPPTGLHQGSLGLTLIRSLFPEVAIRRNTGSGMTVSFMIEPGASGLAAV